MMICSGDLFATEKKRVNLVVVFFYNVPMDKHIERLDLDRQIQTQLSCLK
jgi:hypothetical protein